MVKLLSSRLRNQRLRQMVQVKLVSDVKLREIQQEFLAEKDTAAVKVHQQDTTMKMEL